MSKADKEHRVVVGVLFGQINFTLLIISSNKITEIKHKSNCKAQVQFSLRNTSLNQPSLEFIYMERGRYMVQLGNANSLIFPNGVHAQLIKNTILQSHSFKGFFYGVRLKLFSCCSYLVTGQLVTQQPLLSLKINWKYGLHILLLKNLFPFR